MSTKPNKTNKSKGALTEAKAVKALQGLYRENLKMEEKLDTLSLQVNALEVILTTLVSYYKEIKELEQNILKGLK